MAKLVKHESSIDRLSGLPDSVLCHILSLLPTKFAVRTSILSTRWRHLYTSVTSMDFDDNGNPSNSFMNFVDRVLFFHDARCIEIFRLRCGRDDNDVDAYRICGWLSLALRRRLQELRLQFFMRDASGILPASLFTSKTLAKLIVDAYNHFVMIIPSKIFLPSLKILHLELVDFVDDDSVERLLSGCLVLEELVIYSYRWENVSKINISKPSLKRLSLEFFHANEHEDHPLHIVIDAPSLVDLKLFDILAQSYSLVNLPSLVKAHLTGLFDDGDGPINREIVTNLLRGISNVKSLCCSPDFLKLLTLCYKPLPVFHNLVLVEICKSPRSGWGEIGLAEFFAIAPNLETLIFDRRAFKCLSQYQYEKVPPGLLAHLKVIEINSFRGEMKPVEYFLKNASVLEVLKILMHFKLRVEEQLEIAKKLLMLPRASKVCQIEIA